MSTASQPQLEPAWKKEVARRIAAHKNRKGAPHADAPEQAPASGASRAAEAAARVAARYAKAPTYSQLQAEEARMAVRSAEIATKVALQAQAAAETVLAELHAASNEPQRGPAVIESITRARIEPLAEIPIVVAAPDLAEPEISDAASDATSDAASDRAVPEAFFEPAFDFAPEQDSELSPIFPDPEPAPQPVYTQQIVDGRTFGIRWEPDTPVRVLQPRPAPPVEDFELDTQDWWTPAQVSATLHNEPIAVEAQSGFANLIEFPRELVATRKMRPRLAEPAPSASSAERQLSIFEVDPGAVSTDPESALMAAPAPSWSDAAWSAPASTANSWSSPQVSRSDPQFSGPEWSGIQLDEHPLVEQRPDPQPASPAQRIFLAPLGYRLMALVVDGCLILAGFFAVAMMFAGRMQQVPTPRSAETMLVSGLLLAAFLYHAIFVAMRVSTPGMHYAGIALSTFDDEVPTRSQLRRRLGAMTLSLLPVGLGVAWSIFDEDHLTWHDRISQTYLRKR